MGLFGLGKKTTTPPPAQAAAVPAVNTQALNLTGISLAKGASTGISMVKADPTVQITAHLDWDGGTSGRRAKGADLELYVLYVPAADVKTGCDTTFNAIYYRNLGRLHDAPHIQHHGDSRVPGRETATIGRPDQQGYALICAYSAVGNGVGSFREYGAKAIVTDGRGQTVTVPLYDTDRYAYWVAIALVDFTGDGAVISQVEKYSAPGSEARPVLASDGQVLMDAGPVEFK
ncbi:hypothetical protein [Streptomyces sp. NPDC050263]|uniref:hypothetical protein n=1 Tax=Streptomyces sp. NPDC050263 TaxID=3155037 RepID=UPI003428B8DF